MYGNRIVTHLYIKTSIFLGTDKCRVSSSAQKIRYHRNISSSQIGAVFFTLYQVEDEPPDEFKKISLLIFISFAAQEHKITQVSY